MTHTNFCYWLKGFIELNKEHPTFDQWDEVKEHLSKCFNSEPYYPPAMNTDTLPQNHHYYDNPSFNGNSDRIPHNVETKYLWGSQEPYFALEHRKDNLWHMVKYISHASC